MSGSSSRRTPKDTLASGLSCTARSCSSTPQPAPKVSRANVDGIEHKPEYGYADYDTNTILHSDDEAMLAQVVQDDLFKAEVTVAGAKSYETVMGGTMTAPELTVTKIDTIGHV